jgi:hypothetical protein
MFPLNNEELTKNEGLVKRRFDLTAIFIACSEENCTK